MPIKYSWGLFFCLSFIAPESPRTCVLDIHVVITDFSVPGISTFSPLPKDLTVLETHAKIPFTYAFV